MLTGRKSEQEKLLTFYHSDTAEFAAIWGRRRIGKTYLIRETFRNLDGYYLQITGEKKASLASQLANFSKSFSEAFYPKGIKVETPKTWKHAFDMITTTIKEMCGDKKVVLFFDELPWLAGEKSGILSALDYYWNTTWVDMPTLKLVVCGSAASWMMDNIVSNKGGLHNRIQLKIRLEPFSLIETYEFLSVQGHQYTPEQVLQVYLIMGGVPFYLKLLQKKYSIAQNINELCFSSTGILFNEFNELYSSLFSSPESYEEIVQVLAQNPQGLKRTSLIKKLKLSSDGGGVNRRLTALTESGFIKEQIFFSSKKLEKRYVLIDEYTLFYNQWIQPEASSIRMLNTLEQHWQQIIKVPKFFAWRGLAFERCCYKHLPYILKALQIQSISSLGPWQDDGAQIDLYIDRNDDAITLCEIKYTNEPLTIDKQYAQELKNKINVFREKMKTRKQIILAILSVNGMIENLYSKELVAWNITLSHLIGL